MTTSQPTSPDLDFNDPTPQPTQLPRINGVTMLRLGLFQMGLGMMSLLTLGVLNRILIDQDLLGIPATLAGGTLAMYQFVAPARVWFGQLSDSKPLLGYHRTGYVWIGALMLAICLFTGVQVVWLLAGSLSATEGWSLASWGWIGLLALVFALYGLSVGFSSTPFAALLVDVSDEDNRSKLVGVVWSMLMVGIVVGAIISSILLEGLTLETMQATINRLFLIMLGILFVLVITATVGIEQKYSRYGSRSALAGREDQITLKTAWKILTASRQTGIFFTFLIVMTLGLFIQQPVLEPYGGEVFGMTVSESTRLNAYWGTGILAGIPFTGFFLVPRIGKQQSARLGCMLVAISFSLTIGCGFVGSQQWLLIAMILFGFASGITTNGAISLMLDLTAAETAGTFIGAWGLSQALSQASATLIGGALLDLGRQWFAPNLPAAYSTVFLVEAGAMIVAVVLLNRVNVQEFQTDTNQAIADVLATEIE